MAITPYNETLTELRDNIESIRQVLNNNGLNGNNPMNTWASQINTLIESSGELNNTIISNNLDFDNIYNAILEKGQNPVYEDRSTYADAILNIGTVDPDTQ